MSGLVISPTDKSYDLSPTTPILIIGSAPGESFDYNTLKVYVNGEEAYTDSAVRRPAYRARLVSVDDAFTLTLSARRAFLYRVKVTIATEIITGVHSYSATSVFETRAPGVSLAIGAVRRELDSMPNFDEAVAINAISQQLRTVLGGGSMGGFLLRMLRRVRLSQLWSAVKPLSIVRNVDLEPAFAAMTDGDVTINGDIVKALELIDLFWESALAQLGELGVSASFLELLGRSFRSDNDLERLSAACALVLVALGSRDPSSARQALASGVF